MLIFLHTHTLTQTCRHHATWFGFLQYVTVAVNVYVHRTRITRILVRMPSVMSTYKYIYSFGISRTRSHCTLAKMSYARGHNVEKNSSPSPLLRDFRSAGHCGRRLRPPASITSRAVARRRHRPRASAVLMIRDGSVTLFTNRVAATAKRKLRVQRL